MSESGNTTIKPAILVIDDEESIRAYLQHILETNGYTVFTAENGLEGVSLLEQVTVQAVITDIVMPEQEGIETIALIRRKYPATKIVAMSGVGNKSTYLEIANGFGIDGTLSKPFTRDMVLRAVSTAFEKTRT